MVSLLPWERTVRQAVARRRALELLDQKNADEAIRSLGEVEAYHAVKELGLDDAVPILAVLEPQQIQAMLDLDCWHGDRLDLADLLTWLATFREAGLEVLQRAVRTLDLEALALLLRRRLFVALAPEEESSDPEPIPDWLRDPPEELLPLVQTPDGRFVIAARVTDELAEDERERLDEEDRKWILRLVDDLYRDEDWEYVAGALRLASTDLSGPLEDDALRFREGRVEDLGFPPRDRALEIYGPLDPARLGAPPPAPWPALDQSLPARFVEPLDHGLFRAAMASLEDPALVRRIEGDLVPVANRVLVADGAEPGDLDALRGSLERMRGYLELALAEGVEPGLRIETGARRLAEHHLADLFRIGHTLTLREAARARALARGGAFAAGADPLGLLPERERAVLEALLGTRPRFSEVLAPAARAAALSPAEAPAAILASTGWADAQGARPFAAPEDLAVLRAALGELEALAAALPELALPLSAVGPEVLPPPPERHLDVWLTTAGARALSSAEGATERVSPLSPDELTALAGRAGTGGFAEEVVVAAAGRVGGGDAVARRVAAGLRQLGAALAPLGAASAVDPRFVEGVLRRPS